MDICGYRSVTVSKSYSGVALLAPVTVAYRRHAEQGAAWFIGQALKEMLAVAGIEKHDIDGLAVSSFSLAPDTTVTLAEYFDTTLRWAEQVTMGGASAVIALRRAARAIQAGEVEMVACIGGDGHRRESFAELVSNFSDFSRRAAYPYGAAGPNGVFSLITRAYMDAHGATREDFGRICLALRENASHNPLALLREPLTMEDYLRARPIAEPLHLYDCVMPCAGAEGFLVTSIERAQGLGLPYVTVLAAEERHNAYRGDPVQLRLGGDGYGQTLYEGAGITPADIDFVQAYDDYPVIVLLQLEAFGFCEPGRGPEFLRATPLTCDGGGLPLNTCGGQLSAGQAGFAGGFLGLTEAIRQLTDRPLGKGVANARRGLVSGYVIVNYARGICTAGTILARGG